MANSDEYERVLLKAELGSPRDLTAHEKDLLERLTREVSERGNRARKIING